MRRNSEKFENVLNLALDATEAEREKSRDLNIGYNPMDKTWEVIIKYSGDSIELDSRYEVTTLLNEYSIIKATAEDIELLAENILVEYIEKPKKLFFERSVGMAVSDIQIVKNQPFELSGEGVIVGILDSGIDYENAEFLNLDGTTRLLEIWDQTQIGSPPKGYTQGALFTKEAINESMQKESSTKTDEKLTSDTSRHGTEVATIVAGNGGVAHGSDIIAVKLGIPIAGGFPRTTELMQGLDYLINAAFRYQKPLAVNISFGNTYGSHDGNGLLERYIDDVSNYWKSSICVGMGNEGSASGHATGAVQMNRIEVVEIAVDRRQLSFDLQIWKHYEDEVTIAIIGPTGMRSELKENDRGTQRYQIGKTEILLYYGTPSPYSVRQEIYIEFLPLESFVDSGIWKIELQPQKIVTGKYDMWLPSYGSLNQGTQFLIASTVNTITVPATASRVISVGAYDARTLTFADFSGRGGSNNLRLIKPDVVAPGVRVQTTTVGGDIVIVSGTSYATPFVTGSAALLMEWGIVKGNDRYLYGEKLKAALRKGADSLLGFSEYPNQAVGYGKLDLFNTFENIRRL
ncbi:MAG: S8 family peptidase [Eubacteriales bacterium]